MPSQQHLRLIAPSLLLVPSSPRATAAALSPHRDCVVYAAKCPRLTGRSVVLKIYDKSKLSAVKQRSVRREARIMKYLSHKR